MLLTRLRRASERQLFCMLILTSSLLMVPPMQLGLLLNMGACLVRSSQMMLSSMCAWLTKMSAQVDMHLEQLHLQSLSMRHLATC
ncbi:hypothetical protein ACHAWX_000579 [Stephanocyclus meneghinianus]